MATTKDDDSYCVDGVVYRRVSRVIAQRRPFTLMPRDAQERDRWEKRRTDGTMLHDAIHVWFSNRDTACPSPLLGDYLAARPTWILVDSERTVVSDVHGIGGTFDALMFDTHTREFILVDWKRICKLGPDALETYTLQLNAYREILEEEYCIAVAHMLLVWLDPSLSKVVETLIARRPTLEL